MNTRKIGLAGLILMMFTTIFGFANGPVAFYQMGYASIIWYLIGALLFFLPTSMIYAEYGSVYKGTRGGLYAWMEEALGQKWAFIAAFIGLAAWVTWMVSTSQRVWIAFSTALFGSDQTQKWSFLGLTPSQTLGILGILWVLGVAFLVTRGVKSVARVSAVGGIGVMLLNVVLVVASIVVLFSTGGKLAEPIQGVSTFIQSQNPDYQSLMSVISFALFAIFAYGGLEQSAGVIDSVDNPKKTFPKAAIIATIVIGLGYSLAILLWGVTANFVQVHANESANLGNITYILMNNLGVHFGQALHLSDAASQSLGMWLTRFTGLGMFLAYSGTFFILSYGPIKSFILGTPKEIWPKRLVKENNVGVPATAVWLQAAIVTVLILIVTFSGGEAKNIQSILTTMGNVAVDLPYVFLIFAFPLFKRLQDKDRPFVFIKSQTTAVIMTTVVLILLILAILFTLLDPLMGPKKDWLTFFLMIVGPILFGGIAYMIFTTGERRNNI